LTTIPLLTTKEQVKPVRKMSFRGFPWRNYKHLLVICYSCGMAWNSLYIWSFFAPVFLLKGINAYGSAGVLSSISSIAALVAAFIYGKMIDKDKERGLLKNGAVFMGLAFSLRIFISSNPLLLGVLEIIAAMAMSGFNMANFKGLYGEAEGVISVSSHYYKLFIRITGYEPEGRNWTFFEGLTRLQELSYLKYVIKGKIAPTGVPFIYFAKYLAYLQEGGKPYEELRPYLLEDLKIAVGKLKSLGVYVKAITPYGVYYYDKDKVFEYKRVVTFYCYDYELDEMLPLSNQMNGLGGEFTKDITKSLDGVPYKVRGYKGTRKMYRVGKNTKIRYYNLDFKTSRGILRSMYGNRKVTGMVVITPENKREIRLELGKIFS